MLTSVIFPPRKDKWGSLYCIYIVKRLIFQFVQRSPLELTELNVQWPEESYPQGSCLAKGSSFVDWRQERACSRVFFWISIPKTLTFSNALLDVIFLTAYQERMGQGEVEATKNRIWSPGSDSCLQIHYLCLPLHYSFL